MVVLGEECARAKPHPDPYLAAMAALGVGPHESLVIEDSPAGGAGMGVDALHTMQCMYDLSRNMLSRCAAHLDAGQERLGVGARV